MMDERGARYAMQDLRALIKIIGTSVAMIEAGQMTGEDLKQDLSAMRAILNRVEKQA